MVNLSPTLSLKGSFFSEKELPNKIDSVNWMKVYSSRLLDIWIVIPWYIYPSYLLAHVHETKTLTPNSHSHLIFVITNDLSIKLYPNLTVSLSPEIFFSLLCWYMLSWTICSLELSLQNLYPTVYVLFFIYS